jgi:hypothetical protein
LLPVAAAVDLVKAVCVMAAVAVLVAYWQELHY